MIRLFLHVALLSSVLRGQDLALIGGTAYVNPTEAPVSDSIIVIANGRISAVGRRGSVRVPGAVQTLDCQGLTITAGFWNNHVHLFQRKWAGASSIPADELGRQIREMLAQYGFTGAFDLSSAWENTRSLRDRIESGEVPGPRIRSTGEAMLPPGSAPPDQILNMLGVMRTPLPEIADATQARAASQKLLRQGVDGLKLFAVTPAGSLSEDTIRAVTDEAHRAGKPVFTHPGNAAGILAAVRGGVDVIAHTTPLSGPWDEATLAAMKNARVALIPTLTVWKYNARHDRISIQEKTTATAIAQLRAWITAGGTVLFGTDAGYLDYHPGEEYSLMAQAGMNFRQILASLTTAPAERFDQSKRLGRIAPGLEADLVVLKADPARDPGSLAAVKYTIRAGKLVYSDRASERRP